MRDDELWAPLFAAVCAMLDVDAQAPQIPTDAFCSCFGSDLVAALLAMSWKIFPSQCLSATVR